MPYRVLATEILWKACYDLNRFQGYCKKLDKLGKAYIRERTIERHRAFLLNMDAFINSDWCELMCSAAGFNPEAYTRAMRQRLEEEMQVFDNNCKRWMSHVYDHDSGETQANEQTQACP